MPRWVAAFTAISHEKGNETMTTETKATHTPGPWKVITRHTGPHRMHYRIMAGDHEITSWVGDYPEKANARLIAAAPELLAIVQELKAWQVVNAAIKAATE